MRAIVEEDRHRHAPSVGDETWQESFFLGWTDIRNRCSGHHHISLCPALKKAHVWTWLIVDGKEVARSQENALELPDGDLTDINLGVLKFLAGESIRNLHLTASFDTAKVDVEYNAYIDPVHVDINSGNLKLGSRHYESMGSVRGSVTSDGRTVQINGTGWQDHSWGSRRLSSNPAGRWVFAVFGEDLAFSLYSLASSEGTIIFGYVIDSGGVLPIDTARCGFVIADDGISPESCDVTLWTECGKGYRLRGRVVATALVGGPGWSGDGNHFWMDGLTEFEHADRIGGGLLEVSTLKAPTEHQRKVLKLV
jgi:hypothetical protein